MIRGGLVCKYCSPGKCKECPDNSQPLIIECVMCDGLGCIHCDDAGEFQIDECPQRYIGGELIDVISYIDYCGKGMPPIAGGALDQSKWFMSANAFFSGEEVAIQNEKYKR